MWLFDTFIGRMMMNTKPVSEGQRLVVEMAVDPEHGMKSGLFYKDGAVHPEPPEVSNTSNQEKIWAICGHYSGMTS